VDQPSDENPPALRPILRWNFGQPAPAHDRDELSVEEPLEIRVRGRPVSVTMRTPGHDEELAAGFLLSEAIICRAQDVLRIEPCVRNEAGNLIDVILAPEVFVDFDHLTRHVFASSSCGLCGAATVESVQKQFPPVTSGPGIDATTILSLPPKMRQTQETFARTGGLHAAGLFDAAGELIALREDVGRHNAVDKLLGYALLRGLLPLDRHVLLVSGRTSFEIVQKALAGGIPVVASISAPSSLAADFAEKSNQTLIGFLRDQRMNLYTHPGRIRFQAS